ncbi:OmpA family protein [Aquimarina algiphila]|uniref:OmpA family protein n=1 Tax=Aquimarina algiphila TaxID=2047982 RepID=UPI00232CC3A5|nr:OmpA family protein [Aquimarina algiphila]
MKKIVYTSLIIFITSLSGWSGLAQQRILNIANKMFDQHKYVSAQEAYLKVIERKYRNAETLKNLGDSYYLNGQPENAEQWYKEFIESYPDQIEPEYLFRYAQCLKSLKNYSASDIYMDRLLMVKNDDQRANLFNKKRDYLKRITYQSGRYDIENATINSNFTDFGAAFYKDYIVFSSSRDTLLFNKRIHKWTEESFLELYQAKYDSETNTLSDPQKFSKELSTKFHESTPVFTNDGNTIYFTRNYDSDDKREVIGLKIYRSTKDPEGNWTLPEDLPFNDNTYSTSHPSISPDGKTLYFSSDMPGGFGMSDLYSVTIYDDGSFGTPINLGNEINTEGKETFPFTTYDELYFASDGHPGLGGLDIFVTKTTTSTLEIINVGSPINTPKDDFAFIINTETEKGYFSSNRDEGKGGDDIYSFHQIIPLKSFFLTTTLGAITDNSTYEAINDATITIYDKENNIIQEETSVENGNYYFSSNEELKNAYSIKVTKNGYKPYEHIIEKEEFAEVYEKPITLEKIYDNSLELERINDNSIGYENAFNFELIADPIHFDNTSINIVPKSKNKLDELIALMKRYPRVHTDIKSYLDDDIDSMEIPQNRADVIKQYFIDNRIPEYRLSAKGVPKNDVKKEEKLRLMMVVPTPIHFNLNSEEIRPEGETGLLKVIELMNIYPTMKMEIHGHADSRSSYWYNKLLSVRRMRATLKYITEKGRINWRRIRGRAYGERRLFNDCGDGVPCTEDQHQKNRRSEFIIVK